MTLPFHRREPGLGPEASRPPRGTLAWTGVAMAAALVLAAVPARAEEQVPQELEGASIVERPGAELPRDVVLMDQEGRERTLGTYLEDGKPVVLVLAYYRCPMLCSLVVNGLTDGLRDLAWGAGKDYRVLVVSFDPRDTVAIAREKRANYLKEYGRAVPADGFEFLIGDEKNVRRLADSVGFGYRWDEQTQQYAHAAGAFVVTPQGRLSRTLYGIVYPAKDLRLALNEAAEGKLGSAWDRVVLFCYHYDPNARGYVLAANKIMKAGGVGSLVVLSLVLARLWRRERSGPSERVTRS